MANDTKQQVALANEAIATAIKDQVAIQIDSSVSKHTAFVNTPELIQAIESIDDPKEQAKLYTKYLNVLEAHQSVKNEVWSELIKKNIERNNKIIDAEIEKDQARTAVFSNTALLLFFMCFPIFIAILFIVFSSSYFFAGFIIIV